MATGTIKRNGLKSGTLSATTTEYGNIVSDIPKSDKLVIAVKVTPTSGYGGGILLDNRSLDVLVFKCFESRGGNLANTAVTITYYYYEV